MPLSNQSAVRIIFLRVLQYCFLNRVFLILIFLVFGSLILFASFLYLNDASLWPAICALLAGSLCFSLFLLYFYRFARSARNFTCLTNGQLSLVVDLQMVGSINWNAFLEAIGKELIRLEEFFGTRLHQKPLIIGCPSQAMFRWVEPHSSKLDGLALCHAYLILINADHGQPRLMEMAIHELVHLFNPKLGPFNAEGLATWLQGTSYDRPIHFRAMDSIRNAKTMNLSELFRPKIFSRMKKSGASLVAASFIGYLIDSYGRPTAKRFICARHANPQNDFTKTFGITLANAEQNWRQWLKHYSCDAQQN